MIEIISVGVLLNLIKNLTTFLECIESQLEHILVVGFIEVSHDFAQTHIKLVEVVHTCLQMLSVLSSDLLLVKHE